MPNFGGSRLGFWFNRGLQSACSLIPEYKRSDLENLDCSYTGPGQCGPTQLKYVVNNNYITYTVNGFGYGALGDANLGLGLKFDPTGNGNYGTDDYIRPGSPFEAYQSIANGIRLGGANMSTSGLGFNSTTTLMWDLSIPGVYSHFVTLQNAGSFNGRFITHYVTYPNEPIIRMKMTYENGDPSFTRTGMKMLRIIDPDIDAFTFGNYSTNNFRGYAPANIPATDIVYALGSTSGRALSLYCPGNGYVHNTAVLRDWPTAAYDVILSGRNDGNGDHAIACAWDIGDVPPNTSVSVCCYYICGSNIAEAIKRIDGVDR